MAKIANKLIPIYELDHIYIVVYKKMLKEAAVQSLTITESGAVTFRFKVAQEDYPIPAADIDFYYDIDAYRNNISQLDRRHISIKALLMALGVVEPILNTSKANATATQYLTPIGYVVNDSMVIEEIEFPSSWTFARTIPAELGADANGNVQLPRVWEHNANFAGRTIYQTYGDALKEHKPKLQKLDGSEVEYDA